MKKALDAGEAAMSVGKMADAEAAYSDAAELEPSNEVAATGQAIAKTARVEGLNSAMAQAKSGGSTEEARAALKSGCRWRDGA